MTFLPVLFSVLIGGVIYPSNERYVSSLGSDANPGTLIAPWQTISKVNSSTTTGQTIYFRKDDRFSDAVLDLQSSRTYTSYGFGADPIISGGTTVTGWTLFDAGKNIWRTTYSAATSRPRNLWVNGVRVTRPSIAVPTGLTATGTGLSSASSSAPGFLSTYAQPDKLEVVLRFLWEEQRVPITAVSGNNITLQTFALNRLNALYANFGSLNAGDTAYRVENAYEIFYAAGSLGTFFHDETASYLYLIPPTGISDPTTVEVIAPVRTSLVTATGVSNATVSGLVFAYVNTTQPTDSGGFIDVQSTAVMPSSGVFDNQLLVASPSAITFDSCTDITFSSNVVQSMGINALRIKAGSSGCVINGNVFRDLSGVAISDGDPSSITLTTTSTTITNNLVQDSGLEFRGASAVVHWFGLNTTISNNLIRRQPYTGISSGWGWVSTNAGTRNTGEIIQYNKIYTIMQTMLDGGGIYLNAGRVSASVTSNWIYDVGTVATGIYGSNALYFDDGCSGVTATDNVSYQIFGAYPDYQHNNNIVGGNTGGGNVSDVGTVHSTGPAPSTPNTVTLSAIGLSAAQTAGAASGAGLESPYAHLATDYP